MVEYYNPHSNPNPNCDPIQNNCKYGYILPDRCRYWRHKGCPCGAYPPIEEKIDEKTNSS